MSCPADENLENALENVGYLLTSNLLYFLLNWPNVRLIVKGGNWSESHWLCRFHYYQ